MSDGLSGGPIGVVGVVLGATNFTAASDAAVDVAIAVAQHLGARLMLVHVLEDNLDPRIAEARLAEVAARASGLEVTTQVLRGEPGHEIARAADRARADLVVIGRGRPSAALIANSVDDVLARTQPCPVLTIAEGQNPSDIVARLTARSTDRRCLVCARAAGDLICPACRDRIMADAIEGKRRVEKSAGRGV